MPTQCRRRDFILGAASCTGILAVSPSALAGATRPSSAKAKRVLVLNLSGGVRSSAAFVASANKQLNPWGRIEGIALPLGKVLAPQQRPREVFIGADDAPRRRRRRRAVQPATAQIPSIAALSSEFSVVGTWDAARGDHLRSERVAHTGATDEASAGVLVRIFGAMMELDRRRRPKLPAFELGESGAASYTPRGFEDGATVQVLSPQQLPRRDDTMLVGAGRTGVGYVPRVSARDALDQAMLDRVGPGGRAAVLAYTQQRSLASRLSSKLDAPALDYGQGFAPGAELGMLRFGAREVPLSNAVLSEILETGAGPDPGPQDNLLLAVRLLQLGSPAVSLTIPGFDSHSGEDQLAPGLYGRLGNIWAGLHFVLKHLRDPDDASASMLDTTLVVTNSEFGRDPGLPRTGFNGGGGSDHGSHPATFYVGHAVMGAGTRRGQFLGQVDTDSFDARRSAVRYAPSDLLATMLFALGLSSQRFGFADARPITSLWGGR